VENDQSVTVVVSRRVVPGMESQYEQWVGHVNRASERFPGQQGSTFQGPTDSNEYHTIFRYDTIEHMRQWENSKERAVWTAKLNGIVEGDSRIDHYTGLEFLFDPGVAPIKKHKMALLLTFVVFVMIVTVRPIIGIFVPNLPNPVQLFLTVAIQVSAMTYLIMPYITRCLAKWLHG